MIKNVIGVYSITEDEFNQIGEIDNAKSIIVNSSFRGVGSFEVTVPLTQKNLELLKKDRILSFGDGKAYFIEYLNYDTSESDGVRQLILRVKGRDTKKILAQRVLKSTVSFEKKYSSEIILTMAANNLIYPTDSKRKYTYTAILNDEGKPLSTYPQIGKYYTYFQKTGGDLLEAIEKVAEEGGIGFDFDFIPQKETFSFKILNSVDRSNPDNENFVCLSTDMESILNSVFNYDKSNYKSVAYVAGEGEGSERKVVIAGDNTSERMERYEVYIDARDLQSTKYEDDTTITLTDEEYELLLEQRGIEKLQDYKEIINYETDIKTFGSQQYIFGVDYNLGDTVLIEDKNLGITVSAFISSLQESWENDEYKLSLTIGYSNLTILDKVKIYAN